MSDNIHPQLHPPDPAMPIGWFADRLEEWADQITDELTKQWQLLNAGPLGAAEAPTVARVVTPEVFRSLATLLRDQLKQLK